MSRRERAEKARLGLPYPTPSSEAVTRQMRGNKRRDTRPELRVRRVLHAAGLRFRVDFTVTTSDRRVRVDIAFSAAKLAIFVDGCFWHGCPLHGHTPGVNAAYWTAKLTRNRERDEAVNQSLREQGWQVMRIWEHETTADALSAVQTHLAAVRSTRVRWTAATGAGAIVDASANASNAASTARSARTRRPGARPGPAGSGRGRARPSRSPRPG